jgi:hypothetical protein
MWFDRVSKNMDGAERFSQARRLRTMSTTDRTIVVLKVTRAIAAAAMIGTLVVGVFGFGPEARLIVGAGAGTVAMAVILAKVTNFVS